MMSGAAAAGFLLAALCGAAAVSAAQIRPVPPNRIPIRPAGTAPANVFVQPRDAFAVTVTWDAVNWAASHAIERSSLPTGPWRQVGVDVVPPSGTPTTPAPTPSSTGGATTLRVPMASSAAAAGRLTGSIIRSASFVDSLDLIPGATYIYRVLAVYPDSTAGISTLASAIVPQPPPVDALTASAERAGVGVRLTWDVPPIAYSRVTEFRVLKNGILIATPTYTPILGQPARPLPLFSDLVATAGQSFTYEVEPVYRISATTTVQGPRRSVQGTAEKTRLWCPPPILALKIDAPGNSETFTLTVTAQDSGSKKLVQGTVRIDGGVNSGTPKTVLGATGQPITVGTCISRVSTGVEKIVACRGTVTAAGYPPAIFAVSAGDRATP